MSTLMPVIIYILLALYFWGAVLYVAGSRSGNARFSTIASLATACGWICNLLALILRTIISGRLPLSSGNEFILSFVFLMILFYLFLERKSQVREAGWIVTSIAALLILFVTISSKGQLGTATYLMPALKSPWLAIHVLTATIAYASFALGAGLAVIHLRQKGENHQEERIYRIVGAGFVMLSLSIVLGAIWAEQAWGSYWSWDPKEDWALITWIIYALYLHLHRKMSWKGEKASWMVIGGFILVLFTFFGVNYLFSGMHSYSVIIGEAAA